MIITVTPLTSIYDHAPDNIMDFGSFFFEVAEPEDRGYVDLLLIRAALCLGHGVDPFHGALL
jgi:hypothetical protein